MSGNDDHAWWADRRTLAGASVTAQASGLPHNPDQHGGTDTDDAVEEPSKWSAEALFADAGFHQSGPTIPPPIDDGVTTVFVTSGLDEARSILGVCTDADWSAVTKAHRSLAKQFHPDRLGDLSPEAQELGQHRMAEINRAYDILREHQNA